MNTDKPGNFQGLPDDDPMRAWTFENGKHPKWDGPINWQKQKPKQERGAQVQSESDLLLTKKGEPRAVLENIIRILEREEWEGLVRYDELGCRAVLTDPTPAHKERCPIDSYPRPWRDSDDAVVTAWMQANCGLFVKPGQMPDAISAVSMKYRFHPVRDYLRGLEWDRKPRLDSWFITYLGASDTPLVRAFAAKFLIGAIARARHPGAKVDHMPILEGPQGSLKSTALRELMPSPELFTDDLGDALGKEAAERIQGKWIVEIAELDAFSKAETTRIKSFITRQADHFRPAYGRHPADFPRQCVFSGSTNQDTYLRDETGGRRFWPVRVGRIDLAGLREARDQLWAEADVRHKDGEMWWLEDSLAEAAGEEQRARFDEDVWHDRIRFFIVGKEQVTIAEVLDGLRIDTARQGDSEKRRAGKTLRALGWREGQIRTGDKKRPRVFRPSPVSPLSPEGEG